MGLLQFLGKNLWVPQHQGPREGFIWSSLTEMWFHLLQNPGWMIYSASSDISIPPDNLYFFNHLLVISIYQLILSSQCPLPASKHEGPKEVWALTLLCYSEAVENTWGCIQSFLPGHVTIDINHHHSCSKVAAIGGLSYENWRIF